MTTSDSTHRLMRAGAIVAICLLALLTGCSGNTASFGSGTDATGKNLSIALSPGWDEDVAVTYLWKELLEKRGYGVNVQELEVGQAYVGVAQKQVDLYLDAWLPSTHKSYWDQYGDKLDVLSKWYTPALLNLAVPDYLTDVNTIDDLRGREAEFGNRIVGIEPGSGLMRLTKDAVIPAYGLQSYQLLESSTPAMLASLNQALTANNPVVVTLWTPHWAFTKFPVKALKDPKGAFGAPDTTDAIAAKGFAQGHPEVAGWLGKFKLDAQQLGTLELLIQQHGEGNEQKAAAEWIANNQQLVESWFG